MRGWCAASAVAQVKRTRSGSVLVDGWPLSRVLGWLIKPLSGRLNSENWCSQSKYRLRRSSLRENNRLGGEKRPRPRSLQKIVVAECERNRWLNGATDQSHYLKKKWSVVHLPINLYGTSNSWSLVVLCWIFIDSSICRLKFSVFFENRKKSN